MIENFNFNQFCAEYAAIDAAEKRNSEKSRALSSLVLKKRMTAKEWWLHRSAFKNEDVFIMPDEFVGDDGEFLPHLRVEETKNGNISFLCVLQRKGKNRIIRFYLSWLVSNQVGYPREMTSDERKAYDSTNPTPITNSHEGQPVENIFKFSELGETLFGAITALRSVRLQIVQILEKFEPSVSKTESDRISSITDPTIRKAEWKKAFAEAPVCKKNYVEWSYSADSPRTIE